MLVFGISSLNLVYVKYSRIENKRQRIPKEQLKGQSRETNNIVCTKRRKATTKTTTQYMLDTTIRKQTQITEIRDVPSYKQLLVKTNRTSFLRKS